MPQPSTRSSSTIMDQRELLQATWAWPIRRIDTWATGFEQINDTTVHAAFHAYFEEDRWGQITDVGPLQPLYRHARFVGYQPTSEADSSSDYSSTRASTHSTADSDMPPLVTPSDTPVVRKRSASLECGRCPRYEAHTPHQFFRYHNRHRATSA